MFGQEEIEPTVGGKANRFKGMLGPKKRKPVTPINKLKKKLKKRSVLQAGKKLGTVGRRSGMGAQTRTQRGRIY